jgi:hypothetical protein
MLTFHNGNAHTKLRRPDRRHITARPAANHYDIKTLFACHFACHLPVILPVICLSLCLSFSNLAGAYGNG